jgi:hypothetical protein
MKRVVLAWIVLLTAASPALAQTPQDDSSAARLPVSFAPAPVPRATGHEGFTVLANVGGGVQHDGYYGETRFGLGGVNFGGGWFFNERCAVLFRASGTRVTYDDFLVTQTSAVYGGTIQLWLNDWASVEAGAGAGKWWDEFGSGTGFGLIFAFEATVFQKGPHHIRATVEYAPVFVNPAIHNVSFNVGYQYAKRK